MKTLYTSCFALLTALAGCGGSDDAATSQLDSGHSHTVQMSAKKQVLEPGQYVVTFAAPQPCQAAELNLTKDEAFNLGTHELPIVTYHSAGLVTDNHMHPMFCMQTPPPSKGTAYLEVTKTTEIDAAADEALTIASVQRVGATNFLPLTGGATTVFQPGEYLVTLSGVGSCYDQEVNVKKSLFYAAGAAPVVQLASNGVVRDDLIRPMVCYQNAVASATVYLHLDTASTVKGIGADGLKVVSAATVTNLTAAH